MDPWILDNLTNISTKVQNLEIRKFTGMIDGEIQIIISRTRSG